MFAPFAFLARIFLFDEDAPHADIAKTEQHMRLGRFAVASGPPDLLIIGFKAARQIGMENEANVGFVDAHAERDGRDHHHVGLGHEAVLVDLARLLAHSGVIGESANAVIGKIGRRLSGLFPRQAIDDAALTGVFLHE